MKFVFCFLLIGVLLFGMVSPVFAEEVNFTEETPVFDLPSEEPLGSNPENSEIPVDPDSSDSGSLDDPGSVEPDSEFGDSLVVLDPESDPEVGEELEEDFFSETGEVHINADAVYLTNPEDPVTYAVGDVLSGGAFFDVSTQQLGDVKIYIPIDYQEGSFAYDNNGNLVNIRSSTITGYILDGTQYTVRWNSFNTPQYRLVNYSGTGNQYQDLDINSVDDTNIQIVTDDSDVPLFPDQRYISLAILAVLGVCMLCLFMKA